MSKTEEQTSEDTVSNDNTIQVFVRVRPPDKDEVSQNSILQVDPNGSTLVLESKPTPRTFSFDHVADIDATQESIFNHLGRKIIDNCVAGYNGTIFAYGQTGSGKTYTMLGPNEEADNLYHEHRGVIPRSFEYLYSLINREQELHGDSKQFLCKCSFLEIYNEQIYDLMEPTAVPLHLRESFKTGVYVAGLAEKVVADASEAYGALNSSMLNRRVASTSMNRESSRSHAIFTLQIESKEKKGSVEHIRTSQLNLVDLAGSERQKDTNATGQRLKEAGSINKSLSNLGNVIMCLVTVSSTGKKRYIPYRDSKLTFLLRDSLGGNAKTTLIACIHPGHKCFGETLSTLQFAKRAKMIKNKAVLNEDAHGDIRTLQAEIRALKEELRAVKAGTIPREPGTVSGSSEPPSQLKEMFLQAMELQYRATNEKLELQKEMDKLKEAYDKRGNFLRSTKMILKFRDSTIAKLEGKAKETKEEQIEKLEKELNYLREQLEHQLDGYSLIKENSHLKTEVNRLMTANCLANIQANEKRVCMLEAKYNELKTEQSQEGDEPSATPQRCDAVSTATVEKLRSQVSSLESENTQLKKNLSELQESSNKKEMLLTSELDSFKMKSEELERMLKTNTTVNRIEKEQINERHLQTVKTITTPRKERYRLRNRTVIGESFTPDLNESIPFESPEKLNDEASPFDDNQDTLLEDANKALLEQIKQLQDSNSDLETRLAEYETDRVKQLQQHSMLDSQLKQMEEMLQKAKSETTEARCEQSTLEAKLRDVKVDYESAMGEIHDLRIIMDSADKELKESKEKVKAREAVMMGLESKISEINVIIDQISKENFVLTEEKDVLTVDVENATETARFYESQAGELEETLRLKEKEIKGLEHSLQVSELTIRDEREKLESYMMQNMAQDNEKETVILAKMEEIKTLTSKIGVLKNEHEALEGTAALLRDELEAKEMAVLALEKKLLTADEKINSQISQIESLNIRYADLEQTLATNQEQITFLQSDNASYVKKIEEQSAQHEAKLTEKVEEYKKLEANYETLSEDHSKLFEDYNNLADEITSSRKELATSEEQRIKLEGEINLLKEAVRSLNLKQETELPQKQAEISELRSEYDRVTASWLEVKKENEDLKCVQKELCSAKETLETKYQELKEKYQANKQSHNKTCEEFCQVQEKIRQVQDNLAAAEVERCKTSEEKNQLQLQIEQLNNELWTAYNDKSDLEQHILRLNKVAQTDQMAKEDLQQRLTKSEEERQRGQQEVSKLFGLFRDTLSEEDMTIPNLAQTVQKLKDRNQELWKENVDLSGHHNLKQKIHHVQKLMEENANMKQEVECLRKENDRLKKSNGANTINRQPLHEKQINS